MAENQNNNSVKTSWINVEVSAPIIIFIALPIIFLTFCSIHNFKDDYITILLLGLTALLVIIFLILVFFKPENLTIDGRGHLAIKKEEAKRKTGGQL
ncbi:MAG TPA: hypothetical protein VIV55_03660 [Flavobacterium sp.]